MNGIVRVTEGKERFWPLLLLADPERQAVRRYLEQGEMFVLFEDGEPLCEAVVLPLDGATLEVKNLATTPARQGEGLAGRMLGFLCREYAGRYRRLLVGTSERGVPFYEAQGFRYAFTRKDFFLTEYREPVIEDGVRCRDMICLARALEEETER